MGHFNHPLLVELQPIEGVTRVGSWSACSSITSGSRTMTVDPANLTGLADGDYVLLVATVGSVSSTGPTFDQVPAGWDLLYERIRSGSYASPFHRNQAAYGRKYKSTDTAWTWRVNYFVATEACWTAIAFRNTGLHPLDHIILEPDDPRVAQNHLYISPRRANSAVSFQVVARPHTGAAGPMLDYATADKLQPFSYLSGVNHAHSSGSNRWDIQFGRCTRGAADNQLASVSAIGSYAPEGNVGKVNLNAVDKIRSGSTVKYEREFRTVNTGSSQPHYLSKDVTCEAGKRYWVRFNLCARASAGTDYYWAATVSAPSGGLTGSAFFATTVSASSSTLSGQIGTLAPSRGARGGGYSGLPDYCSKEGWFCFDAAETGTYQIRFYVVRQTTDLLSWSAGASGVTALECYFGGVAVAEGYLPLRSSTDASAQPSLAQFQGLTPGMSYDFQPSQRLNTPSDVLQPALSGELVIAGTPLNEVKLWAPKGSSNLTRALNSDLLSYTNAFPRPWRNWDDEGGGLARHYGFMADRPVHQKYDLGAGEQNGRYYWEITVTGTVSGTNTCFGIVPPMAAHGPAFTSTNPSWVGRRGNGSTAEAGAFTSAGTVSALATNDVMGFALDIPAGTLALYKNGSLERTIDLTAYSLFPAQLATKSVYWAAVGAGQSNFDFATDPEFSFSCNFKGPFTYSKPSGYVAYDYANEVP
jgi:hypothetical protein